MFSEEVNDVALSQARRQAIVDLLVCEIGKDQYSTAFSVEVFAETHGVSKQSVYRYLDALEAESKIVKTKKGKENKYTLVETFNQFIYPVIGLAEDAVWNKAVKPLLKDMPVVAQRNCNYAFCEILNNVIDHSEGFEVIVQIRINAFKVSITIMDNGIGIFTKIATALNLEEKRFAILELAKGKFTTDPESHTGEGIFFSAKAVDLFAIFSDDLVFTSLGFQERIHDLIQVGKQPAQNGTTVFMEVFREHSTTLSELFDQYTQEPDRYGFTKTVVPVRLLEYGDPNPTFVSRSQAKRLLARFERFERIELDFSGIDEIGQGFADEVFRVFCVGHPNSKIIATNYNQRVGQMINRVTIQLHHAAVI